MADATYPNKVYRDQGGDQITVKSGGVINIETGGIVKANGTQASAITAITDSTGGTPGTTFAAITAGGAYAQADLVAIKNALAQIAVTLNALNTAIKNAGLTA